jgi:hypothetical protein
VSLLIPKVNLDFQRRIQRFEAYVFHHQSLESEREQRSRLYRGERWQSPTTAFIEKLITAAPVSWQRGALEALVHLEFPGTDPREITRSLKELDEYERDVQCSEYSRTMHVYSLPEAQQNDEEFFEQIRLKNQVFGSAGITGEQYVRSLFIKACYRNVPQKHRLGYIRKRRRGKYIKADLLFEVEIDDESVLLLVEVKNKREHYCNRSPVLTDLIVKSRELDALPVFVAAHLSADAKQLCRETGIAFLELGYQVLPNRENKKRLKKIPENVLAKHEYCLINPKRPFHHKDKVSPESQEHINIISDKSWLIEANKIWSQKQKIDLGK